MKKSTFKTWETALLLALAAVLLWGAWTAHSQDALAQKMIRLHNPAIFVYTPSIR